MKTIAVIGTFDSKGPEFLYVKGLIEDLGLKAYMIHSGVFEPAFTPDVSNAEVAAAAGYDIKEVAAKKDRALGTEAMSKGTAAIVPKLFQEGKFDGIISFGGSGGTSLATPAMRALPVGVPKVMVSTMASGNVAQYVGTSDIVMMPSIVDVAGLNKISKKIFKNAVCAVAGMVTLGEEKTEAGEEKPLIAATMFGVTTPCVDQAKAYLEDKGYEVLVFHATGTGGRTMEALVDAGFFTGVLDLTTTEWCDEVCGGVLSAGPDRCSAAVKAGIPLVTSVGACDMCNFGPMETVPEKYKDRNLYKHNPTVTLMRTTPEENVEIGKNLADKWDKASREIVILLPKKGVSMIDAEGQPFDGPKERETLFATIKENIANDKVKICEMDNNINDQDFALTAAKELIRLIEEA
ncbi:MAG: Tm-1-like ATP-binding domain-containing protein [Lachnospiraceae bacterium]|nr:Tm-1-like ATP-binding domain-containing protein [Lachnospiraceae bacterium]